MPLWHEVAAWTNTSDWLRARIKLSGYQTRQTCSFLLLKYTKPVSVSNREEKDATTGLQIILESVRTLVSAKNAFRLTKEQERWVVSIMLTVTLLKLLLLVYCRSFKNGIVRAYAQDHFFDVITNGIGLTSALLANRTGHWMDPLGAIILALYTIGTWSKTVLENVNSLVGKSATAEYMRKLTYMCWNHHEAIRQIDTVRAYSFGTHYFVEVDIVLPSDMPLRVAHDIGESLQNKLEMLPEIERAFLHLDYDCTHKPEHSHSG
ncbi:PREDICTED: metal tolerance protein 11-like isoform X3 [Tarenaya hassleriana]|uniref:metal tolerance protein 11-like isoform X3 n=1 Tax=Tarenaya hassleriana TaxID=28532 RepID=UPI00053C96F0|nr:PREDICTED: metal tolerance protein 11-like isoform X3 [Tarenaya hassleriana]XP_010520176.1 PREDICTED: metal tolerance protein 11-like isoform X3 [Tarenaya hassleriana]